jgi:ferredoxin
LTELNGGDGHRFIVTAATERGAEVLAELETERAVPEELAAAQRAVEQAGQAQQRKLDLAAAKSALEKRFDDPHWQKVAGRCLACGNCTQVCPTCFCTSYEDATDVPAEHATRVRHWDSCFSLQFSYIHGGSVRSTVAARYRQWLMHKLATWQEQFGESGCVGCGRCITWCPVGIDITAEARVFEEAAHGNT